MPEPRSRRNAERLSDLVKELRARYAQSPTMQRYCDALEQGKAVNRQLFVRAAIQRGEIVDDFSS